MDGDDDFTFCRVAPPSEQGGLPSTHLVHGIGRTSAADYPYAVFGGAKNGSPLWKDKLRRWLGLRTAGGGDDKVSVPQVEENKSSSRKVAPRAKVPFEKGHSQMNWLKLTRTHPDLAGLKGTSNRRHISMDEVRRHHMEGSMWTVLKGRVYNISPYMKFHPGGVDMLMKAVGNDCTSLFNKYHAWVNAEFLLEKCLIGTLDDSKK